MGLILDEIMFRDNMVMMGYLKNPEATKRAFDDGWFHSGGLAVLEPDGYVRIKDRSKDIIISGGENISSVAIEEAFYRHPAIATVAVVAMPDEKWGELPVALLSSGGSDGLRGGAPSSRPRAPGGKPVSTFPDHVLASDGLVNDRYRVDFYEVAWGHYRYPDHHVRRFVISKERNLRFFDDRNVFIAVIIDNVDRDLANLLRPRTCRTERPAEIAECQARLRRKITMPDELAVYVFGLLT